MATWEEVRTQRDALLAASDWTQVTDIPDTVDRWSWVLYRHHLRNLPQKYTTADDVVWPEPPPAAQAPMELL